MRNIFPLRWSCPFASRIPWRFSTALMMASDSRPSGAETVVTESVGTLGKIDSASAFIAARAAAALRAWRSQMFSIPSARISESPATSERTSEMAGVNGVSPAS